MTAYATTEAEQELLDYARRILGDNLAEFLLSGLKDASHLRRRSYTVQSGDGHRKIRNYKLDVISEDGRGVPAGRDPLVLAAVLHLMWTRRAYFDEVAFRDEVLLERLGWADMPESRRAIEAAVERYYSTSYRLQRAEPRGPGEMEVRYSQVQQLVAGYDTTDEWSSETSNTERKSTVIYFAAGFVEGVSTEQKYFLGIDFERLGPLQLVQSEID